MILDTAACRECCISENKQAVGLRTVLHNWINWSRYSALFHKYRVW